MHPETMCDVMVATVTADGNSVSLNKHKDILYSFIKCFIIRSLVK